MKNSYKLTEIKQNLYSNILLKWQQSHTIYWHEDNTVWFIPLMEWCQLDSVQNQQSYDFMIKVKCLQVENKFTKNSTKIIFTNKLAYLQKISMCYKP